MKEWLDEGMDGWMDGCMAYGMLIQLHLGPVHLLMILPSSELGYISAKLKEAQSIGDGVTGCS